jgi:hypothetical protein
MKIPCEIVVWYVLPIIRREVANELVNTHHMTQADVARRFGVTDAAISQYLKKKRGDSSMIENMESYPIFLKNIKESARAIAEDGADFDLELCRLCAVVRSIGLLQDIAKQQLNQDVVSCESMVKTEEFKK